MVSWMSLSLQDSACYLMEQLIFFHDHTMFFLLLILSVVGYNLMWVSLSKCVNLQFLFNEWAETLWTLLPGGILLAIGLPSLKALYLSDEVVNPTLTVKSVGHQWYWTYEYSDFSFSFDSYPAKELSWGENRVLEVDNRLVLPVSTKVRMIVTSSDVIHSWAVPSLGVKMDANPGRLNQIAMESDRVGIFYGQCSEICGAFHSFMPISLEVVSMEMFFNWLLMNSSEGMN